MAQGTQSSLTKQMGLDQKLGAYLPKDVAFKDESGKVVKFGEMFQGRPVLLVPIFFTCKTMCVNIADGLATTLAKATRTDSMKPGRDLDVVMLSINHKETPDLAMAKKVEIFNVLTPPKGAKGEDIEWRKTAEPGWHMLTGTEENIRAITNAVGFKFSYDHRTDIINHPSASMILTPEGQVSTYIVGPTFPTSVMKSDLDMAARGEVGQAVDQSFMFGCVRFDQTGKYTIVIENVIRLACVLTLLLVGGMIVRMSLQERRKAHLTGGEPALR
jgi:protein SCO1